MALPTVFLSYYKSEWNRSTFYRTRAIFPLSCKRAFSLYQTSAQSKTRCCLFWRRPEHIIKSEGQGRSNFQVIVYSSHFL